MPADAQSAADVATTTTIDRELIQRLEEHLVVDTSERDPVFLLVGRNGSHIRLSSSAVQLLRQVGRGVSFDDIAAAVNQRGAGKVAAVDVESSYRTVVRQIAAIEARGDALRGAFWFRRGILPAALVQRIARGGAKAFHAGVVGVFIAATVALGFVAGASSLVPDSLSAGAGHFWAAYGLFLASLVAHEIGHASACARFGARPSEIGIALYVIYPVFYSNVSAAWTLRRWQRVVVDLGGVYFQLVVGAIYVAAYARTGWEPLRVATWLILGSCGFSLNPLLKFDGYWVVADALGVTNLSRQPARIVAHLAARLRRRPAPALPWTPLVTVLLAIYAALSIGFWIWFIWQVAPAMPRYAIHGVEVLVGLAVQLASSPAWPDGSQLQAALGAAYVLLLVAVMVWRLLRLAGRGAHSLLRSKV
jgi:putative peptide zinc metalloprotease protein